MVSAYDKIAEQRYEVEAYQYNTKRTRDKKTTMEWYTDIEDMQNELSDIYPELAEARRDHAAYKEIVKNQEAATEVIMCTRVCINFKILFNI